MDRSRLVAILVTEVLGWLGRWTYRSCSRRRQELLWHYPARQALLLGVCRERPRRVSRYEFAPGTEPFRF